MPPNVFVHSVLVQSREVDNHRIGRVREALTYYSIESGIALAICFMINLFVTTVFTKAFCGTEQANNIGLMDAGQYLQEKFSGGLFPILHIWGYGLLAAGQNSPIMGTYVGQFTIGGFLNLHLKKWMRAVITGSCAIIPTLIVALVLDSSEDSLDVLTEWVNVLQPIQIPFVLIHLLCLVSKEEVMVFFFEIGLRPSSSARKRQRRYIMCHVIVILDLATRLTRRQQHEGLPGVLFVLTDSYVAAENKDYGGVIEGSRDPELEGVAAPIRVRLYYSPRGAIIWMLPRGSNCAFHSDIASNCINYWPKK